MFSNGQLLEEKSEYAQNTVVVWVLVVVTMANSAIASKQTLKNGII